MWGKGGRGLVTTALALALAIPLAATAGNGNGNGNGNSGPGKGNGNGNAGTKLDITPVAGTYIDAKLLKTARNTPGKTVRVIIQSDGDVKLAGRAGAGLGKLRHQLDFIGAVAMEIDAGKLERLAAVPGLTVTPDADVDQAGPPSSSGYSSSQLWTAESGSNKLWSSLKPATIAIVDSGVDANRADLAGRVKAQVNFVSSGKPNAAGDGRGHGTFVAGIAAGAASGYAGAAPNADLVSLDVMDDSGSGRTSDVIAAAAWIHENKDTYNIKVANFSLHSSSRSHFYDDPLNKAVEKLWFGGVVVVAAAGNYGNAAGPSGVKYSPGNDPFVITVGAADIGGTHQDKDDARAPWSAYGRTDDGFWKPEICAPGRYMVGPVPLGSTLALEKVLSLRGAGYIELSGTSFAAPVIAGVAAQMLARNPSWSPDQVKGALMKHTRSVPKATPLSCGVGQINAVKSGFETNAPNPNAGLNRFLKPASGGSGKVFDAVSWTDSSNGDVAWDSVSWTDGAWGAVSWTDVSWTDVSWTDVSWTDVSWTDYSYEDAAEGDTGDGDGYELTPEELAAAEADPSLMTPDELAAAFSPVASLAPVAPAQPLPPVLP